MPGIFISYRRDDTSGHSGRLFDRLKQHYDNENIFMDIAGIEPGVDFVEAIDNAIKACDVVLVMIGKYWLTSTDASGHRRLDDPNDYVRLEVSAALRRNVRVVPVLVQNADMPTADQLPEDLKPLARRQATELTDARWDLDSQDLIDRLRKHTVVLRREHPIEMIGKRRNWVAGIAAFLLVGSGGLAAWYFGKPAGSKVDLVVAGLPRIRVPSLVGQPVAEAEARLKAAGLREGTKRSKTTTEMASGLVLSQTPEAGEEIATDARVDMVVATRPRVLTQPGSAQFDLAAVQFESQLLGARISKQLTLTNKGGLPVKVQAIALDANKDVFLIGGTRCLDNTLTPGESCIINIYFMPKNIGGYKATLSVSDEHGKTHSQVALAGVATEREMVAAIEVPNVVRMTVDQARATLQKTGLELGREIPWESKIKQGIVLQQITPAGTKVKRGTRIGVYVAASGGN